MAHCWRLCDIAIFLSISFFSAKALDDYAAIRSKASEASEKEDQIDPRLEAIVEKMLDKYDTLIIHCFLVHNKCSNDLKDVFCLSGALVMENINRPWGWLLNAGDWIS